MNTTKKQGNNKGVGKQAGYANLEKGMWKKGQSGNPKGRKPNTFIGEAKQLRDQGYEQVTAEEIRDVFQMLVGLDRMELMKIANDYSFPYSLCAVAKGMLSDKYGMRIIDKILDRVYGKPSKQLGKNENKSFTLADGLLEIKKNNRR